jgi:DNA-dependent RNA polymerase auxiliary subunit epsilon
MSDDAKYHVEFTTSLENKEKKYNNIPAGTIHRHCPSLTKG